VVGGLLEIKGVRLRSLELDTTTATSERRPRIYIRANTPLAEFRADQIGVSPQVDFKHLVSGETIVIELQRPLNYATTYTVSLKDIASKQDPTKMVSKSFSFQTPSAEFIYIQRASMNASDGLFDSTIDRVMLVRSDGTEEEWFSAPKIDSYAHFGNSVAIVTIKEDDSHEVVIKNKTDGTTSTMPLPSRGRVIHVQSNDEGSLLGFSFTDLTVPVNERISKLYFYDPLAGLLFTIKDVDGTPLRALSWRFAPDGSTVAVINEKSTLLFADTIRPEDEPFLYGSARILYGFIADGTELYASDKDGVFALSLSEQKKNYEKTDFYIAESPEVIESIPSKFNAGTGVLKVSTYSYIDSKYSTRIVSRFDKDTELLKTSTLDNSILDVSMSLNDQYVFVETSGVKGAKYDGYNSVTKPSNVQTLILDSRSGSIERTVYGFLVSEFYIL
jgi:hypothetical protein